MPRSFSGPFTTRALAAAQKPYLILEIEWETGSKFYLDRETPARALAPTFKATGTRHPATIEESLVMDWGVLSQTLRETQVGSVDTVSLRIADENGEISAILGASHQQRRTVKIWRMFDEDDVVWPTDAALMFIGVMKPHTYAETDNTISFEIEDPARQWVGSLELLATRELFPNVRDPYVDKNIPLVWGLGERVEAIPISAPWITKALTLAGPAMPIDMKIPVEDHPDDLNAPIGTNIDVYIGTNRRKIRGKFILSSDKAKKPSEFQVTAILGLSTFTLKISSVAGAGTSAAICTAHMSASDYTDGLWQNFSLTGGRSASVLQSGQFRFSELSVVQDMDEAGTFNMRFQSAAMNRNLAAGQILTFYYVRPHVPIDSVEDDGTGEGKFFYLDSDDITPAGYYDNLQNHTTDLEINQGAGFQAIFLEGVAFHPEQILPDTPTPGVYRCWIKAAENDPGIYSSLAPGQVLRFHQHSTPHEPILGSEITPVDFPWVFAVNALESRAIIKVEGWGAARDAAGADKEDFIIIGEESEYDDEGHVMVTSSAWSATLEDDTWIAELDNRRLTTITFTEPPRFYSTRIKHNRIFVTLKGSLVLGSYLTHPALVAYWILKHANLLAVPDANLDEASFTSAVDVGDLAPRKAGFAIMESVDGLTVVQDIARQCQSVIVFDQGKFFWKTLKNDSVEWAATFDETSILGSSLRRSESAVNDLVTCLTANWKYQWNEFTKNRKRTARNPGAEEEFEPANREIDLWIYRDAEWIQAELEFWLVRFSRIYWEFTFTTTGRGLILQPADWVKVGYTDGTGREILPAGTKCEVIEIQDKPGDAVIDVKVRVAKFEF